MALLDVLSQVHSDWFNFASENYIAEERVLEPA